MMNREIDEMRDILPPVEDVPPMPEDTHARWTQAVHQTQQRPAKLSASWKRGLAAAAAAVFLLGGTALTRDTLNAPGKETASDELNGAAMVTYSRSATQEEADYGASNSVMLASGASYDSAAYKASAETAAQTRKLIRTIDLSLGSRTYDASLAAITEACTASGGWVESLSESTGTLRNAYLTLRIPADKLDDFLAGTESWGRMIRRSENTQDVTDAYQDTQARLVTQQALMDRLQALVTTAADLSDVLALESQMAQTQYEIDRLTGILLNTDRQVDYATVSVSLREETAQDEASDQQLSLTQRLQGALVSGWSFMVQWVGDMLVFLTAAAPFLLIAGAIWATVRILRRKRR